MAKECVIPLPDGTTVRVPAFPEPCFYVRFCNKEGMETAYWGDAEWKDAPAEVMGAIFGALAAAHAKQIDARFMQPAKCEKCGAKDFADCKEGWRCEKCGHMHTPPTR